MRRRSRRRPRGAKRVSRDPRRRRLSVERLEDRCLLASVAVTNTLDVVNGDVSSIQALLEDEDNEDGISLREAILAANATPGMDFIDFNIPASDGGFEDGVWTISPTMQLPTIMEAVEINGYSQSGAVENSDPLGINAVLTIELFGANALGAVGLDIAAGGSTIRGLVINNFDIGILIAGNGGNFIEGNFLGTFPDGTVALGNRIGILIEPSSSNTIGGSSPAARNLISGNISTGVEIANSASFDNRVQGNFIGTDRTGLAPLGNGLDGVLLTGDLGQSTYATDNTIGGTGLGEGNVISGNFRNGVQIVLGTFNTVAGNSIGTNVLGNAALPNALSGVLISEGADNVIGGTELNAGNLISGNGFAGVRIAAGNLNPNPHLPPQHATRNTVLGNDIGTDLIGQSPIPNLVGGVFMDTAADSTVSVFDNTLGGTTELARNVISGNGTAGVIMVTPLVTLNKLQGNKIGTNAAGDTPLPNQGPGVLITELFGIDGAPSLNTIGGVVPGAGNLISGNLTNGVEIAFGATANLVQGNFIGTDIDGMQALGNQNHGVAISGGTFNIIGGYDADDGEQDGEVLARNVISGNESDGVWFGNDVDFMATGNLVVGNYIGTNVEGTGPVANNRGVEIEDAIANVIGTAPPDGAPLILGDIQDGANLISGNAELGVLILGEMATANRVDANYIGTNKTATGQVGNSGPGIHIQSAPQNFIGSAEPGGGNVIGGNLQDGVTILLDGAQGNVLHNNRIGYVGNDGQSPVVIPNQGIGVNIIEAPANVIGGVGENMRNVISGNVASGVAIQGPLAVANQVLGNYIGTDEDGMFAAPNLHGVNVIDAGNNVIGDGQAGAGNVLSGNVLVGVLIEGTAQANKVQGNLIGLNADGSAALPNNGGVAITSGADNNIVGTDADGVSDADERNVISGNQGVGVQIVGAGSSGNRIAGNYIGTSVDGTAAMGNQFGVVIASGAQDNFVGDGGSGNVVNRNIISGNLESGVVVAGGNPNAQTKLNAISTNFIGTSVNGEDPLPNAHYGVFVNGANETSIADNTIAFNGEGLELKGHGIAVAAGVDNEIRRNSIHHNAGRGIDLGNANDSLLKTINDPGDGDSGANNLQNYPVVTQVSFSGGMKTIKWELDGVDANEEYTFEFYSNTALDPSGFGEGEKYLDMTVAETESTSGLLTVEWSFPASEEWISATVTDPDGNTSEFSMVDTDGDALADAWELLGIDVNEDGVLDLPPLILRGASHLHKDVFVEIDAMAGLAPSQNALDMVINGRPGKSEGFANVPNFLVNNPDGLDGINLHLELDGDTDITRRTWSNLDNDWPVDFDLIKNGGAEDLYPDGRFGTPDERILLNWEHIREARRLVYHYALFADDIPAKPRAGQGEFHGNDFYVTLGDWSIQGGTDQDNASTLMHELGHNLGLDHGGGDDINYKPNYYSIMNYIWDDQTTIPENQPGFGEYWRLDYSRSALPTIAPHTLNEMALSEADGFGGDPNIFVPIGPLFDVVPRKPDFVPMGGPVDLNGNGQMDETLPRDVTFLSDTNKDGVFSELDASPDQPLVGYNDWSNLRFDFTGQADFKERTHESSESKGFTLEVFELINSVGIGPGVFEFSHEAYDELESSGMATIRVVRAGGTDGAATVEYSVAADTAMAGDDFTVVSGVLQFADGEFQKTFVIPIVDEGEFELAETIILTLENPTGGATLGGRDAAVLEIVNDDAPPLIGDYNGDGVVGAGDYPVWRNSLGPAAVSPYSGADGDGDGNVTRDDYLLWKSQYGQTLPPAVGNGAADSTPVAAVTSSGPSIESSTAEATAAAANPSPNALRTVSAAIPESRTPLQATSERTRERPARVHVADASDDLLLLAIDRVRHASKKQVAVAVDGEDSPVVDRETVRPFDEPHAAALAAWR